MSRGWSPIFTHSHLRELCKDLEQGTEVQPWEFAIFFLGCWFLVTDPNSLAPPIINCLLFSSQTQKQTVRWPNLQEKKSMLGVRSVWFSQGWIKKALCVGGEGGNWRIKAWEEQKVISKRCQQTTNCVSVHVYERERVRRVAGGGEMSQGWRHWMRFEVENYFTSKHAWSIPLSQYYLFLRFWQPV